MNPDVNCAFDDNGKFMWVHPLRQMYPLHLGLLCVVGVGRAGDTRESSVPSPPFHCERTTALNNKAYELKKEATGKGA